MAWRVCRQGGHRCAPPRRSRRALRPSAAAAAAGEGGGESSSFEAYVLQRQAEFCAAVAELDGAGEFGVDRWEREGGGGYGLTRVLEGGDLVEKGAANVSVVRGTLTPSRAAAMSQRGRAGVDPAGGQPYSAVALSIVLHARSPHVPTFRADVRCFDVAGERWFGGGADLTPAYLHEEDAAAFHAHWRAVCEANAAAGTYEACKRWCDEYFYIPFRQECRGVGGLFFDDLGGSGGSGGGGGAPDLDVADPEGFTRAVCDAFLPSFVPIWERRRAEPYGDAERTWQLQRRGRYLEFNLTVDRGVKFGLDAQGRVESIMVSAPPLVRWDYDVQPPPGSPEAALVEVLMNPREWA